MPSSGRHSDSPRPEQFGRYLLLDRIDVGGMAEVFRGRIGGVEGFERMVALKRILPGIAADSDFVEMFVDEAKLAVQIQHANVAQTYELGLCNGSYFIAMEYVSGVSLRTMWDRARSRSRLLPIAMSCHIIQKVCEGLDAAHRKRDDRTGEDIGLVHRDVSPQNILVSFEGEVKVIDFGIAKAANKVSKTQAGVLKGKFGYMSPEQVRGIELDNRSDIFACGIILYELMVGGRLFLGESDFSTLEKIRNVEMVPPTRLNKNLSTHLERIAMKALSKNRDDRYRWASEMAEDLQRYLFETNQPFARQDLQRYMQQHFKTEMSEEQTRMQTYRNIQVDEEPVAPPGMAKKDLSDEPATDPGLRISTEPTGAVSSPHSSSPPVTQSFVNTPTAQYPGHSAQVMNLAPNPGYGTQVTTNWGHQVGLPTWAAVMIGVLATLLVLTVFSVLFLQPLFFGQQGSLRVSFEPRDSAFYLDDRLLAKGSPVTIDNLEPRTYVVAVRRHGYEDAVRPVSVVGGETRLVVLTLRAQNRSGILEVRTEPSNLEVWLDDEPTGARSPVKLEKLPIGGHEVQIYRPDGALVRRFSVNLRAGIPEFIQFKAAELSPVLEVESSPPGAQVRINGLLRGETPLVVNDLKPGRVRVALRKKGCSPQGFQVDVKQGTVSLVERTLKCSLPK